MADPKLRQARASADKLREGYLRAIAKLPTGLTPDDLDEASELLRDLVAMVETFTPPAATPAPPPAKDRA